MPDRSTTTVPSSESTATPFRARLLLWLPLLVFAVALAALVQDSLSLVAFPLDDAWIHGVYARAFAFGHGFAYNPGQQEAGSTSPLWAIVSAPAHWLSGFGAGWAVLGVKAIGVLLTCLSLFSLAGIGRRLTGSAAAGCAAACLFALEPRLLFSALSGMENSLLLALVLGGCAALLSGRHLLSALLFGLAPATRPEAVLALPLALPGLLAYSRGRGWRPASFVAWVLPGIPLLGWMLFCLATTGHPLPNTYYAKAHAFHLDARALAAAGEVLCDQALLPLPALVLGLAAGLLWLRAQPRRGAWLALLTLVALPLAYLLGVAGTRELRTEGYYWTRWLDPASLLLTATSCLGLGTLLAAPLLRPAGASRRSRAAALAGALAAAAALAYAAPSFGYAFASRRFHLSADARVIEQLNVRAGRWIQEHTPPDAVVGVNDAGAIRYFGERRTIDLIGLNYAPLTFRPTDDVEVLRTVDWLVVFPSWLRQTRMWTPATNAFTPRAVFNIPYRELTICHWGGQTCMAVLARRPTTPGPADPSALR